MDGKIERMLETYKLMDELQRKKDEIGPEKHRAFLAQKYFPTNEDGDGDEGEEGDMEEIIKDDESESVYNESNN